MQSERSAATTVVTTVPDKSPAVLPLLGERPRDRVRRTAPATTRGAAATKSERGRGRDGHGSRLCPRAPKTHPWRTKSRGRARWSSSAARPPSRRRLGPPRDRARAATAVGVPRGKHGQRKKAGIVANSWAGTVAATEGQRYMGHCCFAPLLSSAVVAFVRRRSVCYLLLRVVFSGLKVVFALNPWWVGPGPCYESVQVQE